MHTSLVKKGTDGDMCQNNSGGTETGCKEVVQCKKKYCLEQVQCAPAGAPQRQGIAAQPPDHRSGPAGAWRVWRSRAWH